MKQHVLLVVMTSPDAHTRDAVRAALNDLQRLGCHVQDVGTRQSERRAFPRYRLHQPVRLCHSSAPVPQNIDTLLNDLSEGGLCCLSPHMVPCATALQVELPLEDGQGPVHIEGRAAWCRSISHSEQYVLGVAFRQVAAHDQRRLATFLHRLPHRSSDLG